MFFSFFVFTNYNCTFFLYLTMMAQQTDDTTVNPINTEVLALPGPDTSKNNFTKLDATDGKSVKLDELGPMVVNTDGTLSRIANWKEMTDMERERTLRLLSARNKLRLANEERKQQEGDPGDVKEEMIMSSSSPPEV